MGDESPDMCVVKECLRGAGLYDENLEKNEMMTYYNFLKSSVTTTSESKKKPKQQVTERDDLERIDIVESPPRFKPQTWSSRKKPAVDVTNNNNTTITKESPQKEESTDVALSSEDELSTTVTLVPKEEASGKEQVQTESVRRRKAYDKLNSVDVYTCEVQSFVRLKPVVVPARYSAPIYCQERFQSLSVHEKVREIVDYHNELAGVRYGLQRKSSKFAELPGCIQPSASFSGEMEKRKSTEADGVVPEKTYTSRSGRAVKRKIYAEGVSSDDDDDFVSAPGGSKEEPPKSAKKSERLDEDFEIGKGKADTPKGPKRQKASVKKPSTEEMLNGSSLFANTPPSKRQTENSAEGKKRLQESFDNVETAKPADTPKLQKRPKSSAKKLSNEEIMNRSKLFSGSPGRNRSERLFDKMVEDRDKGKKADIERRKFQDSLDKIEDDDSDYDLKITSSQSLVPTVPMGGMSGPEETITKLRVVPPLTGRKGYKRKQTFVPVEEVVRRQNNGETSSPPNKVTALSDEVELVQKNTNSSKKEAKKNLQPCPICNREFPRKDIEDHASTCGLTSELEIENDLPTTTTTTTVQNNGDTLRCEICDKLFLVTTMYEVHVRDCIREHT